LFKPNPLLTAGHYSETLATLRNVSVHFPAFAASVGARGLVVGVGLVTVRLGFDSPHGSFASNLGQVAYLLRAQINSAFYPQQDRK